MKKFMILGAALVAFAAVTAPAMAADPLPFPSPQVKQVFIATQTVAARRDDEQLLRSGQHGRLPLVRRRPEDAVDRRREGRQVLLRLDSRSAERQVQVRPVSSGCLEGPSLDGDLDRSRDIPAGNRRLQGAAQADDQAAGPVRADAGVDVDVDDPEQAAGSDAAGPERGRSGHDAVRTDQPVALRRHRSRERGR